MNKLLIAAALSLVGVAPAHANLVVDGGFEDPSVGNGAFATFTSIPGWTGAATIEVQDHIAGTPFAGNNLVELDTNANSAMFQDIATVAGQTYEITFEYSPRPGIAASSNGIEFLWNGVVIDTIAQSGVNVPDTVWTKFTFDEIATGPLSRIGFAATGTSDSYGGYLDNVTANAAVTVPEPGMWSLFGAGFVLAVVKRRRRQPA